MKYTAIPGLTRAAWPQTPGPRLSGEEEACMSLPAVAMTSPLWVQIGRFLPHDQGDRVARAGVNEVLYLCPLFSPPFKPPVCQGPILPPI